MSKLQLRNKSNKNRDIITRDYYKHTFLEPVHLTDENYSHPVLYVNGHLHKMVSLHEFMERLVQSSKTNVRNCNNEIEAKRYRELREIIWQDMGDHKNQEVSYWNQRKKLTDPEEKTKIRARELQGWQRLLKKRVPRKAFFPIDIDLYAEEIESKYGRMPSKWEEIGKHTYLCALYLPSKKNLEFMVKHNDLEGIFYQSCAMQEMKSQSIKTIPPVEKMIKKVKEIRHFNLKSSVFNKFIQDDEAILDRAFELDNELSKMPKFVKDKDDLNKSMKVLRKHYPNLKNQFISQIANPKSYPVIDWLDFVDACNHWDIIDKNLTATDIDRIFIATNFEEEDLEENDDNSLCRFEFLEIIARMAKTKYYEKGLCPTVWESLDKLITEYIIPNTCEHMEW